ncbi:hypothetical protein PUNSTDRAFT_135018 [Punctularia strigosozonata HHB-11173 SS5]|uniref:uncharacterized protein n=1 Tax=Punctularia strigosozonata (strain HHB-11173) TaxID=741275 RepID=UPI0004416D88|nr:uncharacterized protein PUNSTDRAFT_135018 [Punctularia strigosozonata HHB-11173 SS5]EIN08640.1 hypothetical protein PUNSTDRAFT_135018 [Punctularia strigosozonata HHB-11173 SS5]
MVNQSKSEREIRLLIHQMRSLLELAEGMLDAPGADVLGELNEEPEPPLPTPTIPTSPRSGQKATVKSPARVRPGMHPTLGAGTTSRAAGGKQRAVDNVEPCLSTPMSSDAEDDTCSPIDVDRPYYEMPSFKSRGVRIETIGSPSMSGRPSGPSRAVTRLPVGTTPMASPAQPAASFSHPATPTRMPMLSPGNANPNAAAARDQTPAPAQGTSGQPIPSHLRWYAITMGSKVGVVRGWHIARANTLPFESMCNVFDTQEEAQEIFDEAFLSGSVLVRLNNNWVEVTRDPMFVPYILPLTQIPPPQ